MPTPQETAYPTLRSQISKRTLGDVYSPNALEVSFVEKHSRTPQYRACMLTLLKCAQRLGYFVFLMGLPGCIPKHIAEHIGCPYTPKMLRKYDNARIRTDHIKKIRSYLNIKPADETARSKAREAMENAARTKEDIVDILNVGVEELVHLRYELPKFNHLLRISYEARKKTNDEIYAVVFGAIPETTRNQLENLLKTDPETKRSPWDQLRQDPGKLTLKEINAAIERLQWIRSIDFPFDPFASIPYVKFRHFAMEAKSLNANRVDSIAFPKKSVLLAAMVKSALARTIDDIVLMVIKKIRKIHYAGKVRLDNYLEENKGNTDRIVTNYMTIHDYAYDKNEKDLEKKLAAIRKIFDKSPELVEFSTQHAVIIIVSCGRYSATPALPFSKYYFNRNSYPRVPIKLYPRRSGLLGPTIKPEVNGFPGPLWTQKPGNSTQWMIFLGFRTNGGIWSLAKNDGIVPRTLSTVISSRFACSRSS